MRQNKLGEGQDGWDYFLSHLPAQEPETQPNAALEERCEASRHTFTEFIRLVEPSYVFNWHHQVVIKHMERVARGECRRLMLFMQPQSGKSLLASRLLPAWMLGRDPDLPVMAATYNDYWAGRFNRDVQRYIDTDIYRAIFPATRLWSKNVRTVAQGTWLRNSDMFEVVGQKGIYRSAGVGSGITGQGFLLGIIDDPIKNPLSVDTPVPTPAGWTTMGQLRVGDQVFDHAGFVTRIASVTARMSAPRCRVTFSDGAHVDAHPDHPWTAFSRGDHSVYTQSHDGYGADWWQWPGQGRARIRSAVTTAEIAATLRDQRGMTNWIVPNAFCLQTSDAELPVAPYVLGLWLGDGDSRDGKLTAHVDDCDYYLEEIRRSALSARVSLISPAAATSSPETRVVRVSVLPGGDLPSHTADSFRKRLRAIGVIENKHVPLIYLRAGAGQRLALLRGLMDTDGTNAGGQAVFCNTNRHLIDAVAELIVSLGAKCTIREVTNEYGPYWLVASTPWFCPFSLPRKVATWEAESGQPSIRRRNRTVKSVEVLLEQTEYVCVGVEAESSLFLAGRGMIPVHNSKEANSPTYQDSLEEWYTTGFHTRQGRNAAIILMCTRWADMDLAGRLLKRAREDKNADQWEVVSFPAVGIGEGSHPDDHRPAGQLLWPDKFDQEEMDRRRAACSSYTWSCLYQQDPKPTEGGIFDAKNFRYFGVMESAQGGVDFVIEDDTDQTVRVPAWRCLWFQSCDTARKVTKSSDFMAVLTWAFDRLSKRLFLYHVFRQRVEMPRQFKMLQGLRYGPKFWNRNVDKPNSEPWPMPLSFQFVEEDAGGINLIQQGVDAGTPFKSRNPSRYGDKESRCGPISTRYENHLVYHRRGASWLHEFEHELSRFPTGEHDDQADCCGWAGILCQEEAVFRTASTHDVVVDGRETGGNDLLDFSLDIPESNR